MHPISEERYVLRESGTTPAFSYCHKAARNALKVASEKPLGATYFCMMAGTFAAFTVEAFLNHLGQEVVADWEIFERKLGPKEKLALLKQMLHLSTDSSRRPFQTLNLMFKLRDAIAHGKTAVIKSERIIQRPSDDPTDASEPEWKKLCSVESVTRMVEDAEAIVRDLFLQTGRTRDPFVGMGHTWSGVEPAENLWGGMICKAVDAVPHGTRVRRWTLRDDNNRHYHGIVQLAESPLFIELSWRRTAADPVRRVGTFCLNLAGLLHGDFVRREPAHSSDPSLRLRIVRADDGKFYIQAKNDGPRAYLAESVASVV